MVSYGTQEAIVRLVETYSDMLLRLAASRLSSVDDAEDAVQEVFLYLLERSVTFRDAEHEKAWLIRTTLHRASNIRKRVSSQNLPLEEEAFPAPRRTITANCLMPCAHCRKNIARCFTCIIMKAIP